MPCYSPLKAFHSQGKPIQFRETVGFSPINLSCGQCVGCRLERSRQWAVRCLHEASLYERNCFITLTYAPEHLPPDGGLHYSDFQEFMKRLRFHHRGHRPLADGRYAIRFFMCGEYGENFGRPHFHACLFNFDFEDKKLWSTTEAKSKLFRSSALEKLWPFGFSSIGDVNFKSAAYVARYIMKKVNGQAAARHYVNPKTGEVLTPEFTKMSLKPGIGSEWFDKFHKDVYPHDYVVVNGRKCVPPKYYDKKYFKMTAFDVAEFEFLDADSSFPIDIKSTPVSFELDALKQQRHENAQLLLDNNTPERLAVRERLQKLNLERLKRKLE